MKENTWFVGRTARSSALDVERIESGWNGGRLEVLERHAEEFGGIAHLEASSAVRLSQLDRSAKAASLESFFLKRCKWFL